MFPRGQVSASFQSRRQQSSLEGGFRETQAGTVHIEREGEQSPVLRSGFRLGQGSQARFGIQGYGQGLTLERAKLS